MKLFLPFTLLLGLLSPPCSAENIDAVCEGLSGVITASFEAGDAKFAGASIRLSNGKVVDLEDFALTQSSGQLTWFTGKLNNSISSFRLSLWKARTVCKGQKCEWCRRNGHHMEGRLWDSDWRPCSGAAGWQ